MGQTNINYNTEAICENVDTLTLCEILGIPVKKKGATYFSECPNPEHHEEKIFSHNKIYPGNGGCHCFACGKTYRPYGIAKDWLEKQGQVVSGSEIYGILGDAAGEPVVISPLYEQRIRLRDGCQVENGEPAVRAWPVKIENGKVWVGNDALVMRAEAS